jgi:hypothetical protein
MGRRQRMILSVGRNVSSRAVFHQVLQRGLVYRQNMRPSDTPPQRRWK